jgi:outer membrane lipoprotein LolB
VKRRAVRAHPPVLGWLAASMLLLAGCSTLAPATRTAGAESFSGRLAVHIEPDGSAPARSFTAAFELEGNATSGRLDLTTPLGTIVGRARWSPNAVTLATPRGESAYPDLDALTHDVIGESLPVAALFDWLRGRPWPDAGAEPSPDGRGFAQLGWSVDLARFTDDALLIAHRAQPPAVDVRIKLDR